MDRTANHRVIICLCARAIKTRYKKFPESNLFACKSSMTENKIEELHRLKIGTGACRVKELRAAIIWI